MALSVSQDLCIAVGLVVAVFEHGLILHHFVANNGWLSRWKLPRLAVYYP